jgi:hypothetical protein
MARLFIEDTPKYLDESLTEVEQEIELRRAISAGDQAAIRYNYYREDAVRRVTNPPAAPLFRIFNTHNRAPTFDVERQIINDWDIMVTHGLHSGKRLKQLPREFMEWVLANVESGDLLPIRDALIRISARAGVTRILGRIKPPAILVIEREFELLRRPAGVDPQYFASFIEMCAVKAANKDDMLRLDGFEHRLVECGLAHAQPLEEYRRLTSNCFVLPPIVVRKANAFDRTYSHAYNAPDSYRALAILADQTEYGDHAKVMHAVLNGGYEEYLEKFFENDIVAPLEDVGRIGAIAVGCVTAVVNHVSSDCVWGFECSLEDDVDAWSKVMYAHWCLYALRYEKKRYCRVVNFLTGHVFRMIPSGDPAVHVASWRATKAHMKLFETR